MTGRLIALVGPSGVGKDTVMTVLRDLVPGLHLVRRVITRAPDAGGEDYTAVTEQEFAELKEQGAFVLDWTAHGLSYGIPKTEIATLAKGGDALVNLSRAVLGHAHETIENFHVLNLTADPKTLAERLASRSRESKEDIFKRLQRRSDISESDLRLLSFENDGELSETIAAILQAYFPDNEKRSIA